MEAKLAALAHIYHVLDDTLDGKNRFCHRGCTTCCTSNVTMTTLEGYKLSDHLKRIGQTDLIERLSRLSQPYGLQPSRSLNALARDCVENNEIDSDPPPPETGACPLLKDDICTVYPSRPLACRTMVSRQDCRTTGYAVMDEAILSLNNVMLQFTEHIDQGGLSGNLADVLTFLASNKNRHAYQSGERLEIARGFISNHPLTVLMVPPEQRPFITPVLKALNPAMGDIF